MAAQVFSDSINENNNTFDNFEVSNTGEESTRYSQMKIGNPELKKKTNEVKKFKKLLLETLNLFSTNFDNIDTVQGAVESINKYEQLLLKTEKGIKSQTTIQVLIDYEQTLIQNLKHILSNVYIFSFQLRFQKKIEEIKRYFQEKEFTTFEHFQKIFSKSTHDFSQFFEKINSLFSCEKLNNMENIINSKQLRKENKHLKSKLIHSEMFFHNIVIDIQNSSIVEEIESNLMYESIPLEESHFKCVMLNTKKPEKSTDRNDEELIHQFIENVSQFKRENIDLKKQNNNLNTIISKFSKIAKEKSKEVEELKRELKIVTKERNDCFDSADIYIEENEGLKKKLGISSSDLI